MVAIEHGVNVDEVGAIVEFGLEHPAVRGVVLQPVTHVGRHIDFDPMERVTIPEVIHGIVDQTKWCFILEDFVRPPAASLAVRYIPTPSLMAIKRFLCPDYSRLTSIWTTSTIARCPSRPTLKMSRKPWKALGQRRRWPTTSQFECACGPGPDLSDSMNHLKDHIFQIAIKDFMDPYTFNVKQVMKCCFGILVSDGRAIPFCAYNSVGYREEIREQLTFEQALSKIELARRSDS